MTGTLYLIPNSLGECDLTTVLPASQWPLVKRLRQFIVEDERTVRRFLKKMDKSIDIDSLTFHLLNRHTKPEEMSIMLTPLLNGEDMGIISEAGCPAIADPGADVVAIAQARGCRVVPLVGPSSILLSMMASGFNGQSFAFLGYLPIDGGERTKAIKRMESRIWNEHQTQIFIETPYRNDKLVEELLRQCQPNTKLCIATNITLEDESIVTKRIADWRKSPVRIEKKTTIFLLYK